MLMNLNGRDVNSVNYNSMAKELKVVYADGTVRCYYEVPSEIYEKIKNNGGMIGSAINEALDANYRSNVLL